MSEKQMTPEEAVEDNDNTLERDVNDRDIDNNDVGRINDERERDYEEAEERYENESDFEYDDELEQDVEDLESGLDWLETGGSVIGGGVPVMEGANLESAISEAVESEFAYEELSGEGAEKVAKDEEKVQSFFDNSISESSGPEFKPKGVKK